MLRTKHRRILSFILALGILCSLAVMDAVPARADDYYILGSYPQTEVPETAALRGAAYDADAVATVDGVRYKRLEADGSFRYFRFEPLAWQPVQVAGETFLITRNVIDTRPYDEQEYKYVYFAGAPLKYAEAVEWKDSSLCAWLNGTFLETAFTQSERLRLRQQDDGNPVTLIRSGQLLRVSDPQLSKQPTDYAKALGVKIHTGYSDLYEGACMKWLLQDLNSLQQSVVTYVDHAGALNTYQLDTLVSDVGCGIVPCIRVDTSALERFSVSGGNTDTIIYAPWGEARVVKEAEKNNYLAEGWFSAVGEAVSFQPEAINERFKASAIYSEYAPCVRAYATNQSPEIRLEYPKTDPEITEALEWIGGIVQNTLTGDPKDHLAFTLKFKYSSKWTQNSAAGVSRMQAFDEAYAEEFRSAIRACWTPWGNLVNLDYVTGTDGSGYQIMVSLSVNTGGFSVAQNDYLTRLHEIADAARAYADSPLGQIQFIRYYFADHFAYNIKYFNNSPRSLLLNEEGICGSYANLVHELCYLLNIPSLVITNNKWNHAWNLVYLDGAWYHLDTTGIQNADNPMVYDRANWNEEITASDIAGDERYGFLFAFQGSPLYQDDVTEENLAAVMRYVQSHPISASFAPLVITWIGAEGRIPTVLLNRQSLAFPSSTPPEYVNADVQVPVKFFMEALGFSVTEENDGRALTCTRDGTTLKIFTTMRTIYVIKPGVKQTTGMSDTPVIKHGVMYAYTDFLRYLDIESAFDQENRVLSVTDPLAPDAGGEGAPETATFLDVHETDYFAEAVKWAVNRKVTQGVSASEFAPDRNCTNGHIITFLWRIAGEPVPTIRNPYPDLKETDWYYTPALWAYQQGLVDRVSFDGEAECTRASAVEYLWRMQGRPDASVTLKFADVSSGASYCRAVYWAAENGIVMGTSDTTFSPDRTITRAQIVTILYRLHQS